MTPNTASNSLDSSKGWLGTWWETKNWGETRPWDGPECPVDPLFTMIHQRFQDHFPMRCFGFHLDKSGWASVDWSAVQTLMGVFGNIERPATCVAQVYVIQVHNYIDRGIYHICRYSIHLPLNSDSEQIYSHLLLARTLKISKFTTFHEAIWGLSGGYV